MQYILTSTSTAFATLVLLSKSREIYFKKVTIIAVNFMFNKDNQYTNRNWNMSDFRMTSLSEIHCIKKNQFR